MVRFEKKKVSTVLVVVTMIVVCFSCSNVATSTVTDTPVFRNAGTITYSYSGLSYLHTDGGFIKNEFGQIVYLRGCSKMCMEFTDYNVIGSYNIRFGDFENIKNDLNANVVRIDLALSLLFPTFDPQNPDPIYLSYMDKIVSWCQQLDMYILFDLHGYYPQCGAPSDFWNATFGSGISKPYSDMIRDFWVFIANRYNNNPTVCGFDLYNEPWVAEPQAHRPTPSEWATQVRGWIDAITPLNPNLLFIVEDAVHQDWGKDDWRWLSIVSVNRTNVVYSPHFYPENEDGTWGDYSWIGLPGSNFASDYANLNYAAAKREMAAFLEALYPPKNTYALWIGEFGCLDDPAGLQFLNDFLGFCNANGWSWTYWAWVGRPQPSYNLVQPDWATLTPQGSIVKGYT